MTTISSKFKFFTAVLALLFTASTISSCKKEEVVAAETTGNVSVKFEVRLSNGLVLPLSELSNWNIDVEVYSAGAFNAIKTQKATSSAGVTIAGLTPGSYDIECDGVVTYRGSVVRAAGSTGVQVQAGKTATATINLQ